MVLNFKKCRNLLSDFVNPLKTQFFLENTIVRLFVLFTQVSSKEGRSGPQVMTDLLNPTEPVSSKKNLFEAREVPNQNISVTSSKVPDTPSNVVPLGQSSKCCETSPT